MVAFVPACALEFFVFVRVRRACTSSCQTCLQQAEFQVDAFYEAFEGISEGACESMQLTEVGRAAAMAGWSPSAERQCVADLGCQLCSERRASGVEPDWKRDCIGNTAADLHGGATPLLERTDVASSSATLTHAGPALDAGGRERA